MFSFYVVYGTELYIILLWREKRSWKHPKANRLGIMWS